MSNSRYETDEFRIVPPAEKGGDYLVVSKSDGATVAIMRYRKVSPVMRRWRVRPVGAPSSTPWTGSDTMMGAARYGYHNRVNQ